MAYKKNKLYKNFRLLSRDTQFWFFRKWSDIVSPQWMIFQKKLFLMLHSINWPNFIVWWSLLLEILGNMCIAIICFPGCDVINSKINLIFLIKPFLYMTKKSRCERNKFVVKQKASFVIFKELSVAKSCRRPESVPLIAIT